VSETLNEAGPINCEQGENDYTNVKQLATDDCDTEHVTHHLYGLSPSFIKTCLSKTARTTK